MGPKTPPWQRWRFRKGAVSFTAFRFVTRVVKIPPESITRIKDATGQICSTFDAVTAVVFKCCVLDLVLPDDAEVRVGFTASMRCTSSMACCRRLTTTSTTYTPWASPGPAINVICEASLQEVASGMQKAKEALTSRLT